MRIVTANARHGLRPDGVVDTDALAAAVAALDADLVALQEVDRDPATGVDQPGAVAAAIGGSEVFAPLAAGGTTGLALVARGPLVEPRVLRSTSRKGHARGWRGHVPLLHPDPRAALLATTVLDGVAVRVATAHLHLVRAVSHGQLERVVGALATRPGPRLLLGDLNRRTPWVGPTVAAADLALLADDTPTHPAARPVRRIDHVAAAGLRVVGSRVVALPVSDHRALVVDLEPEPTGAVLDRLGDR